MNTTVTNSTQSLLHPPYMEGLSPAQALRLGEEYLTRCAVESSRRTAELLLTHVLRTDRAGLYVRREGLARQEAVWLAKALAHHANGHPHPYVVGDQQFMGLVLGRWPRHFDPRP